MGFFLFMAACIAIAMIGVVFPALFWWSILGAGGLWAIGIVVETVWCYRHPGPTPVESVSPHLGRDGAVARATASTRVGPEEDSRRDVLA